MFASHNLCPIMPKCTKLHVPLFPNPYRHIRQLLCEEANIVHRNGHIAANPPGGRNHTGWKINGRRKVGNFPFQILQISVPRSCCYASMRRQSYKTKPTERQT
ncbi:T-complex protein 1 subunit zeta, putative [Plasmodium ovale wallikeri]|uniref:T-complex protein 1 subunit zeta, putative n=1 Tax=Plasmodium ovale wallikeri TaxID=864142 RepID=A0A1A8Z4Z4_PLAOA|nr:T-complex protein 1 subunit zeta, putative [Plasmodium ovale wallikeri]SBT39567.1 T-complex protein 1 subunit zeta, putative [Plasmodium ovale wallikeri]